MESPFKIGDYVRFVRLKNGYWYDEVKGTVVKINPDTQRVTVAPIRGGSYYRNPSLPWNRVSKIEEVKK